MVGNDDVIKQRSELVLQQWGISLRSGNSLRSLGYPATSCIVQKKHGGCGGKLPVIYDSDNDAVVIAVNNVIDKLPDNYRAVCFLYYVKAMSFKAICNALHCKVNQLRDILTTVRGCVYTVCC